MKIVKLSCRDLFLATDLRDGRLADLHRYRLKLWVCGQVQLIVPQQLGREDTRYDNYTNKDRVEEKTQEKQDKFKKQQHFNMSIILYYKVFLLFNVTNFWIGGKNMQ